MGDRNTTFFHNRASYHKKWNIVKRLEDENGRWIKGDNELLNLTTGYFVDLSSTKLVQDCQHLRAEVQPCIPGHLNEELSANFKEDELWEALKTMAPLKASASDPRASLAELQRMERKRG
ncbi:uncharacterized protein LOC128291594 [Gossypium arboreum]|uniref:uncharacterized protein LOC128291594 n=1 Tax=Gossypium arboreum TaxID=29729 RepID=UPI0022F1B305|nr:uncharacterized protein LOC128291594 [Gossypium arboreum]